MTGDSTLQWLPEHGPDESYTAQLPWRRNAFLADRYYLVYRWKDGWAYSRPDHPDLGRLEGRSKTLDEAKAACGGDYVIVARLHRWHLYMCANDPPGSTC